MIGPGLETEKHIYPNTDRVQCIELLCW